MGLFGRRRARWDERWALFPAVGGCGETFLVDLGAVAAAPVAGLPLRLTVALDVPAGPPVSPVQTPPAVCALDDELAAVARRSGGALVGRRLLAGSAEYTCYLPREPQRPLALSRPARVSAEADPDWRHLREVLAPDEWQRHLADDLLVVAALAGHGDPLTEPRPVEHVGYLPDRDAAGAAAAELRADGFQVSVEPADEGEYELLAVRNDPVAPPAVHELTRRVRDCVRRHGGGYDGWNSVLVR